MLLLYVIGYVAVCCSTVLGKTQLWQLQNDVTHPTVQKLISEDVLDHWSSLDNAVQVVVRPEHLDYAHQTLQKDGLEIKVLENDLEDLIQQEQQHLQSKRRRRKRAVGSMDWSSYHPLEDIEGYLGWLNASYNGLVTVFPVAVTENHNRVYVVKVSNGIPHPQKKKIWIEGGIHAREWISPSVTTYVLHQVVSSREFAALLKDVDWYFVPVSNPDGYAYSFSGGMARLWRKNRKRNGLFGRLCRGIDLNRNWPLKWGVGASSNPCSNVFKGSEPFSEPETAGLARVMKREGPFDLFITFHSYGQSVLYPFGWTKERPPNYQSLVKMGNRFVEAVKHASRGATTYKLGGSAETYGLASGASDDWSYGELGVPYSYTIELPDNGRHGFLLPESEIVDSVQEASVGVYCMASYLTGTGVCADGHRRSSEPRNSAESSSRVIFE